MRYARYIVLVLFPSLLMMILTGCERRDILDDYPVSEVRIKLDWGGLTGHLPEGKWVIIYPEDSSLKPLLHEMQEDEIVDSLPMGHYSILMLAMDKSITCHEFLGMENIGSATMALKGPVKDWQYPNPEMVYGVRGNIDLVNNKKEELILVSRPLVMKVSFTINLPGIHELHACLKGIPTAISLKNLTPVYVNPENCIELDSDYTNSVLSVSGAILMPNNVKPVSRAFDDIALQLEISVTYDDGSTEQINVNVTKAVYAAASDEPEEVVFNLEKVGMSATIIGWTESNGGEVIVK